ncbi:MAG: NAD(P)H-dependent oxidoreductase subunit E [Terriglobia bacterium]
MATLTSVPLVESEQEFLDRVIAEQRGRPGALLGILEKAQDHNPRKFLPRETLEYIAAKTDTPLARVYSVVTFYALFNLDPQGKNTICICRGTACHTRGSRELLESLMFKLGFHNPDDELTDKIALNTSDGQYTIRTVACFGQCALAPVVEVNHEVYGHMNEQTLQRELKHLGRETAKK